MRWFLLIADEYSILWMYPTLIIHSPAEECLDSFLFLMIINKVTINICLQDFMWTYVYNSLFKDQDHKMADSISLIFLLWSGPCLGMTEKGRAPTYIEVFVPLQPTVWLGIEFCDGSSLLHFYSLLCDFKVSSILMLEIISWKIINSAKF